MSMSLQELLALFSKETLATLYMVSISTLISYAIGIPLGVILVVTEEGSIAPNKMIHGILGFFTNIFRTIPFLILLVMVLPITKALVHTTLGPKAIIPPLRLCGDNAGMIAYASVSEWNKENFASLDLNAKPSLAFETME